MDSHSIQEPQMYPDDMDPFTMGPPSLGNQQKPPSFDAMLNGIRSITKKVEIIKGFKFDVSGAPSNNFHLSHSWTIPYSTNARPDPRNPRKMGKEAYYTLGAQFLGGELRTIMDQPKIILTGRLDSTGKLEAAAIKKIRKNITLRLNALYMNSDVNFSQVSLDMDIDGDNYCNTIKYGTGMFSFNLMQNIGKRIVAGFEFMHLSERKMSLFNYAFRYKPQQNHTFYFQYIAPSEQMILAYSNQIKKKALLVSEAEINMSDGSTAAVLGYKQKFSSSEIIATLNTKGKISSILNIYGFAYKLKLCALANYFKDSYKFGYGIEMGQIQ